MTMVLENFISYDAQPKENDGDSNVYEYQSHYTRKKEPEWDLWAAVLYEGIHYLRASKGKSQAVRRLQWFLSEDEHVGSFRFVCEVVGVEYTSFRHDVCTEHNNRDWEQVYVIALPSSVLNTDEGMDADNDQV